jgi:hypothetical protein
MGTFSAVTMGIAVLLAIIFAGVQDHPFGYVAGDAPIVTVIPIKGTTFVAGSSYSALSTCSHSTYLRRHVCIPQHHIYIRWSGYDTFCEAYPVH